jgi:hypothetical protein
MDHSDRPQSSSASRFTADLSAEREVGFAPRQKSEQN